MNLCVGLECVVSWIPSLTLCDICDGSFELSIWLEEGIPTCLVKHYVCLWACFWKRPAFGFVDWVRKICPPPMWVSTMQPTKCLDRTKRQKKGVFLAPSLNPNLVFWSWDTLLLCLDIRTPGSPASGLWELHKQPPVSQAFSLRLRITSENSSQALAWGLHLDWTVPLASWLSEWPTMGLLGHHNYGGQFP